MRSILLLSLVARCLETIDVCIWRMFVVCGNAMLNTDKTICTLFTPDPA